MLTYALILTIISLGAFLVYRECKTAPEEWQCEYCAESVFGLDTCPYCGNTKDSWDDKHGR